MARSSTSGSSKRWLPAAVVPAVIAGGVVVGTVQAGAATDLPDKTPREVLALAAGTDVRQLSGTVEQSSQLGLPQLPETEETDSGSSAAALLDLLTGSHSARVYLDGHDKARVQVLDRLAERDVVRNGRDVWFYSSRQNEAVHALLPERTAKEAKEAKESVQARSGDDAGYTPESLASRFLEAVEPSTRVTVGEDVRVAGRDAYRLLLDPESADTLVDSVAIAVDAATGLPLSVDVQARGQQEPAFELAYTKLSLGAPDPGVFDFTPPAGASVTEHVVPDHAVQRGARSPRDKGADAQQPDSKAAKTGDGWDTVVELSATSLPEGWADSPAMAQALRKVDGGRLLSTALVNVLLTDDGRVFAGSVTPERLQAAAEGR